MLAIRLSVLLFQPALLGDEYKDEYEAEQSVSDPQEQRVLDEAYADEGPRTADFRVNR